MWRDKVRERNPKKAKKEREGERKEEGVCIMLATFLRI